MNEKAKILVLSTRDKFEAEAEKWNKNWSLAVSCLKVLENILVNTVFEKEQEIQSVRKYFPVHSEYSTCGPVTSYLLCIP